MGLRTQHGTVSTYVRHVDGCKGGKKCRCIWWAYIRNTAEGTKIRRSLNCTSETEATEQATELFRSLNPEVKKAAEAAAATKRNQKTVEEAIDLFMTRTEREFGKGGAYNCYRSLLGWRKKDKTHGRLLTYIERYNLEHPDTPIQTIDQITPIWLREFYSNWDYSNSSMQQRWGLMKTFFTFFVEMEVLVKSPAEHIKAVPCDGLYRNLPLSPEQYDKIAETAADDRRLYCFLELMRRTGCDLEDAIMFRSDSIDADGVLRYHRQKTGVEAVIPLEPETLALLRTIPLDKDCMPEMPFRRRDINMVADHKLWYVRLKELFAKAGVTEVRYKEVVKAVSPKCLRHTFATAELAAGQDIPSVSKMLGHSTTAQTEKVYLPWVPQRDEAHIKKVREAQQKAAKNEVQVVAQGGKRIAVQ